MSLILRNVKDMLEFHLCCWYFPHILTNFEGRIKPFSTIDVDSWSEKSENTKYLTVKINNEQYRQTLARQNDQGNGKHYTYNINLFVVVVDILHTLCVLHYVCLSLGTQICLNATNVGFSGQS